ncbi:MAG TPA: methyltransferase, partial [Micromonosporaceae bacterium]|nr:methyltransferase [Micromonosporaceae bacterium]
MPPMPPARVVRTVEAVRARLQRLTQLMVPAPVALLELAMSSMVTQAIYVAAELRLADTLADGPRTAEEMAREAGSDPEATHRLLRMLAGYRIFTEQPDGRFALTPMASALRSDVPGSMRDMAVLMGHPIHWEDWGHLVDSVRTGEPSLPKLRGMGAFEYFEANPEYGAVFMGGMSTLSNMETEPILAGYDFSRYRTIVDVGGGRGALLAGILQRATTSQGVLFDSRAADFGAAETFEAAGVADRYTIDAGGLFDPVTPDGDAYLLKHIVHDWPQAQALEILGNVRKAIKPDGRLLLLEFVTPQGNQPHPAKLVDLWLMLLVGGR